MREVKTNSTRYYTDENNKAQGLYRTYYFGNEKRCRCECILKDDMYHGEYRAYDRDGIRKKHRFHRIISDEVDVEDITDEVLAFMNGKNRNYTDEDKLMIKLKFGIDCL